MENRAYQDSDGTPEEGLSLVQRIKSGMSTAIGATAALGVILALGVWFYRLGDRDARSVPIIRAEAGPTKKIPDDPGGEKTPHQGIKSYEAGTSTTATAGAAVIAAGPPEPKPEDLPMGVLAPVEKPAEKPAEKPGDAAAERKLPQTGADVEGGPKRVKAPVSDDERVAAAPDAAKIAPVRPETSENETGAEKPPEKRPEEPAAASEDADKTDDAATVPDEELVFPEATANAPDKSPFAPRRPQNLIERNKVAAAVAVEEKQDLAAEAARSPVQIQLVADPDRDAVIRLWKKVYRENVDILQGRALAVQSTISGGVTWYRLRVGPFKSRAEAASVCQALKARSQDCIVSRNS